MRRITMQSQSLGGPHTVVIEASWKVIVEYDLNTLDGEEFDRLEDIISIEVDRDEISFVACRSIHKVERPVWTFDRDVIASIHAAPCVKCARSN